MSAGSALAVDPKSRLAEWDNEPIRPAQKAIDGWYLADPDELNKGIKPESDSEKPILGLDDFIAKVPENIDGSSLPIPGARMIIAPHAGYIYSGQTAAYAYSCLDLSNAKRVFVLGPSHTYGLSGCAASSFSAYATPLGNLTIDQDVVEKIKEAGDMPYMPRHRKYGEKAEHSLEMHMPFLYKACERTFKSAEEFPKIVPLLVGNHNLEEAEEMGSVLLPYVQDPENAFIISTDFCHWGDNFDYMPYLPTGDINNIKHLQYGGKTPAGPPIHESIQILDNAAMDAVKSGSHKAFVDVLRKTRNTVCGRYPIGLAMAALELYSEDAEDNKKARFSIIKYARSNKVMNTTQFSVSYVAAYAVL